MTIKTTKMPEPNLSLPAWVAFDMDSLDGSGPIGLGATEGDAIADLLRNSRAMKIVTHTYDGRYWTATVGDYYDLGEPCGSGLTEAEAVSDLLEKLEMVG